MTLFKIVYANRKMSRSNSGTPSSERNATDLIIVIVKIIFVLINFLNTEGLIFSNVLLSLHIGVTSEWKILNTKYNY